MLRNSQYYICTWNINGLLQEKFTNLVHSIKNNDILLETWLKQNNQSIFDIKGYSQICMCRSTTNPRAKRGSGGLMNFIRKEIMDGISIVSNNSKSEDRIWLKLSAKVFGFDKDVFICSLYISPQRSSHIASRNDIWGLLQDEIIRYSNEGFIIMTGDFNARIGQENWIMCIMILPLMYHFSLITMQITH